MSPMRRRELASLQPLIEKRNLQCPFQAATVHPVSCTKVSGVCSIAEYRQDPLTRGVQITNGSLRATCPSRFDEDGTIYRWVAETILRTSSPRVVTQVPFLKRHHDVAKAKRLEDVGRIDCVLIRPAMTPLEWCALEIQGVYFSGQKMEMDFREILTGKEEIGLPAGRRRPDDRSSGPKRLMPQLQIKVPSLRRWGKKMAVVVDEGFFRSMGAIPEVGNISNCDIVWFPVRFVESGAYAVLTPTEPHFTTLESSVEGLTGGLPVSKEESLRLEFERSLC